MDPAVVVRSLVHRYDGGGGELTVLDGLDLEVEQGEFVALVGASGSGKSTLLAVLGGLERPQSGIVQVMGHDLATLSSDGLAGFRSRQVGFVFQHFGLLDSLTAAENVELACTLRRQPGAARRRRVAELLERLGVADRARHRPSQLSGGERQRVAMARALANQPSVVLADEPTGNLDRDSTHMVGDVLRRLPAEHGCTVVLVTHDRELASRADRCLLLDNGRLTPERGSPPEYDIVTTAAPVER